MKAWYVESDGAPVRCLDRPAPQLRPGAAVIDVTAVHVPAYFGALAGGAAALPAPLVLGAGGVGVVASVADDVFGLGPGDVVALDCLVRTGDAADPEEVLVGLGEDEVGGAQTDRVRAMRAQWRDGVMAEQVALPQGAVTRLPGAERYREPARLAFLTWLAIAAEGVDRAGLRPGDVVAVLGATGQMGGGAVLVALARGASRVVAVGRDADALARLAALDARVVTVEMTGDRAEDGAAIAGAAGRPHVVVDALGAVSSPDASMAGFDALHDGGSMVLLGGVRTDLPVPYGELLRRRLTLCGSRMYTPSTVLGVWRMVEAGLVDLGAVGMSTVGLDDLDTALEQAGTTRGLAFVALVP